MRSKGLVLGVMLGVTLACAPPALAYPGSPTSSIVSLGDSYISGEAGRWQGNTSNNLGDRNGTDRAAVCSTPLTCTYDAGRVYLYGTDANNCHRSDTAEILSANIPVGLKVNLACSGAQTANVFYSSEGGQAFKGEAPQGDQLGFIARATNVKMIVLSIGGNDLGFATLVQECLTAYLTMAGPCEDEQRRAINRVFVPVMGRIDRAIKSIRGVMAANGYRNVPYKLVVQSYPSVLPRSAENRYPEGDPLRAAEGGCPFYDSDSDWARDDAVRQISRGIRAVALANNAQFLDLQDAFQGREFCSTSSATVGIGQTPDGSVHEWGRYVNQGSLTQGELQESFHPNSFGQRALGKCVELIWAQTGPEYDCVNTPGQGPSGMQLGGA